MFCSYESDFKPSTHTPLDEDEGFSDWTQKLDRRTRPRTEENGRAEESPIHARSIQKTSFTTSIQHHQTPDREQEMEQVQEKRPVRRSSERRMEISDKVSKQRPDEWHEDIRDIKEKQEEPKTPVDNKVGGGMTEQLSY